jgi:replicative DNA helicase
MIGESNAYYAKKYSDVLKKGLKYIDDRRKGRIKSFKTPWTGVNLAGINGIEWGSLVTIAARPSSGKTMWVSQLLKDSHIYNPDQDFNILEFQFEMDDKQYAARQYAAEVAKDYNVILSAHTKIDDFIFNQLIQYHDDTEILEKKGILRKLIGTPLTHLDIEKAIKHHYVDMGSKPLIVTIDHSWLVKKSPDEKEKINTLYNTADTLIRVKNDLPVIIFVVSQLNRTLEEPARRLPGSIVNYPSTSDLFGGDALQQSSDMVFALSRPWVLDIPTYGPKNYIAGKTDVFLHILKARNGSQDESILFLRMDGPVQKFFEQPEPLQGTAPTFQRKYKP